MCYASPVMLRGRCSCASSIRPTPSSFASSSLSRLLTPLFPLDASHSPISPLFPLHTQKQGRVAGVIGLVTYLKYVGAATISFLHATQSLHVQPNARGTERSLDYATRRATLRRGRENRVAPLGMTARTRGKRKAGGCQDQRIVRTYSGKRKAGTMYRAPTSGKETGRACAEIGGKVLTDTDYATKT